MKRQLKFLDLFAGGGGLSEGFIQGGFKPVAHVEVNQAACFTLRTRMAYHWLKARDRADIYANYLNEEISRSEFYKSIPERVINSVINAEIDQATLPSIFQRIDGILGKQRLDLIIGGPPCQAYSLVGRSRDRNRMIGDRRNYLYIYYAEFLKRYNPRYFVFENVTGLLSARNENNESYFEAMAQLFEECGYKTEYMTLSAEEHGALQRRKRVILVGKMGKSGGFYPEPDKWNPDVKVQEALCDLPAISAGKGKPGPCRARKYRGTWQFDAGIRNEEVPITWHQARPHSAQDLEIYRRAVDLWDKEKARISYNELPKRLKTHRNQNSFLDRFKVVASDQPFSHTVVAHIAKDGHHYIHPDIKQNRSITPREAARLQTFPDDYYFESASSIPRYTPVFYQIGNAVPVLLARKIAEKMKEVWQ